MNVTVVPAVLSVPGPRVLLNPALRFTTWVAHRALKSETWNEIKVVLTDDQDIADLNGQFLRHKGPTDVISFRIDPVPGEHGPSGEIYVNVQRAAQRGTKRWPASRELALYIAHGVDHLGGASDDKPRLRAQMRRRELQWLRDAARSGISLRLISG